jgi:hypothetical protein
MREVKTLDNSGKNFSSISNDNVVKFLMKLWYLFYSELFVLELYMLCWLTMLNTVPKETSLVTLYEFVFTL